jgi:signal transduction histidine kinase
VSAVVRSATEPVNVLLVDDQPAKLLSYRVILQDVEAALVSAGSAREALDLLLRREFAVVIVDVCMPELDGFELASLMRQHPRFERTAIIFVSGVHLTDLDRLKGYACGAVDYLPVPIVPEILRAKVRAFVELYRKTRELERLNHELEQRVAERTAELEDASRRKDEFLAVLAHELRNPLAAIGTAAELVGFTHLPAAQRAGAAGVIQRQVRQLVRLIDDLLDVSRITRGVITLQREEVELSAAVAQALESCATLADERGHQLDVHLPDESLRVHGDPARLSQVLGNVLNNAIKFTDRGGRVGIAVTRDGDEACICVTDTGVGVAPEMLPRVFELFAQGQRRLERASTGLGIGLALVQRLVQMHGGSVGIASAGVDRGTEVTIRLPLIAAAAPVAALSPAPPAMTLPPTRILVVDDNGDAAESMAMMLRLGGHEVLTAENGLEALRLAPAFQPQAVLLDLGMPKLNGYDTARRMREMPWGRDIALVALTGWGQPADRDRTLAAGFNAHLVKPVHHHTVVETLHGLARRRSDRGADRPRSSSPSAS